MKIGGINTLFYYSRSKICGKVIGQSSFGKTSHMRLSNGDIRAITVVGIMWLDLPGGVP